MKKINKKGFTLIELMAVITILGILLLIAVPSVSKYLTQSQESAYHDLEKTIENASKNYLIDNQDLIPLPNETKKVELANLINGNYLYEIKDPQNDGKFCSGYASIKRIDNGSSMNFNLKYEACLKCRKYQSPGCSK
ncbi:MAG: type II secretion system protein [Bacilli bacterium]